MSCWGYYWGNGPALYGDQRPCGPTNTSIPAVPCCVSGDTCPGLRNCSIATKQQFNAAAPGDLKPFYAVPDDGEPVATQPTMGTTPNAPSSTTLVSTSSGLPAGAAAGIGMGAGVATMVVISYAAWFVYRRRRKGRSTSLPPPGPATGANPQSEQLPPQLNYIVSGVARDPSEPRQIPQELEHAGNGPNELPT
ncbi:hypothetical protein PG997_013902 [Apiospora hydei]|uniref:Uncharacterized protein n=1 Tax=Apiospora hydei TaxID=1337664 RepID=A0ABR1V7I8_9PEZI